MPRQRVVPLVLLVTYLAAVALIVLWPSGVDSDLQSALWRALQSTGIPWLTFDLVQTAANVVLFVPIGLLCALLVPWGQMWVIAPGVLALSVLIELAQALLLPARYGANLSDVIANTAGGLVGLGIAYLARRKPQPAA